MTLLAITNPTGTQPQSGLPQHNMAAKSAGPLAVQPPQGASPGGGSGQATSYAGYGAGAGGGGAQDLARRSNSPLPLTGATSGSVVGAQITTQTSVSGAPTPTQNTDDIPKLINTAKKAKEVAAAMPDPLPTSPFLKQIEGD